MIPNVSEKISAIIQPKKPAKRTEYQRDLSAPLDDLTPAQQRVILSMAKYRYMTVKLFILAGVAESETTLRSRILYRLHKRLRGNLLQVKAFTGQVISERAGHIYALTNHGAAVAAELLGTDTDDIIYPKGGIKFKSDYEHRLSYIEFCIHMNKWASERIERDILHMSHYYDETGSNRLGTIARSVNSFPHPKDNTRTLTPDGLFFLHTGTKRRALAMELHRTTDTGRVVEKLLLLAHLTQSGVISKHLKHDAANFVLSVSQTPRAGELVRQRIMEEAGFRAYMPLFLFNDMETIRRDGFGKGWRTADGKEIEIFW